jgi:hypothetical protein
MRIGGSAIFWGIVGTTLVFGALLVFSVNITWKSNGVELEFGARIKREEFLDIKSPDVTAERTDEPFSDVPIAAQPSRRPEDIPTHQCDRLRGIPYFNLSSSNVKQKGGVTVHKILYRQVFETTGIQVLQIEVPPAFSGATAHVVSSASKTVFSQTALHGRGGNPNAVPLCELLKDRRNETAVSIQPGDLFAYLFIAEPGSASFSMEVDKPTSQELLPYNSLPNSTLAEAPLEPPPSRQIDKEKRHLPTKPIVFKTGQTGTSFNEWIAGDEILQRSLDVAEGQRVQVSTTGYAFWLDERKRTIQHGTEFDFMLQSGGTHFLLVEARGKKGATLTINVVITN